MDITYYSSLSSTEIMPCDSRNLNLDPLCTLDNNGSMLNLWKTQVEDVYYKTSNNSTLPDYIKNLSGAQRTKYYDNLIMLQPETGPTTYDAWKEDIAVVNIFFGQNTLKELERSVSMGLVGFISNLGGLFGLFLGFSCISFFELIYWASTGIMRTLIWRHP